MATTPFTRILAVRSGGPLDRHLAAHTEMLARLLPGVEWEDLRPASGPPSAVANAIVAAAAARRADLILVGAAEPGARAAIVHLIYRAPCAIWMTPIAQPPRVTSIGLAVDFSKQSAAAVSVAAPLARNGSGRAQAVHVRVFGPHRLTFADDDAAGKARADEALARFLARVDAGGVDIEPLVVESPSVAMGITDAAREQGHDLIVMSTRGRAHLAARLLLPSDTCAVALESVVSLLALKVPGPGLGLAAAWRDPRVRARSNWRFN